LKVEGCKFSAAADVRLFCRPLETHLAVAHALKRSHPEFPNLQLATFNLQLFTPQSVVAMRLSFWHQMPPAAGQTILLPGIIPSPLR
jgi:hypothetical protein